MNEWDEKTWPQLHEALRIARDALRRIEEILSQDWTGEGRDGDET